MHLKTSWHRFALAAVLAAASVLALPVVAGAAAPGMRWAPETTSVTRIPHACSKHFAADAAVRTGCYSLFTVVNGAHWQFGESSLLDRAAGNASACGAYTTWQRREFDDWEIDPWGGISWMDGASRAVPG